MLAARLFRHQSASGVRRYSSLPEYERALRDSTLAGGVVGMAAGIYFADDVWEAAVFGSTGALGGSCIGPLALAGWPFVLMGMGLPLLSISAWNLSRYTKQRWTAFRAPDSKNTGCAYE